MEKRRDTQGCSASKEQEKVDEEEEEELTLQAILFDLLALPIIYETFVLGCIKHVTLNSIRLFCTLPSYNNLRALLHDV
jgi:hypothetical protein